MTQPGPTDQHSKIQPRSATLATLHCSRGVKSSTDECPKGISANYEGVSKVSSKADFLPALGMSERAVAAI
eukprot:550128-Amphidinium_carterae.3